MLATALLWAALALSPALECREQNWALATRDDAGIISAQADGSLEAWEAGYTQLRTGIGVTIVLEDSVAVLTLIQGSGTDIIRMRRMTGLSEGNCGYVFIYADGAAFMFANHPDFADHEHSDVMEFFSSDGGAKRDSTDTYRGKRS